MLTGFVIDGLRRSEGSYLGCNRRVRGDVTQNTQAQLHCLSIIISILYILLTPATVETYSYYSMHTQKAKPFFVEKPSTHKHAHTHTYTHMHNHTRTHAHTHAHTCTHTHINTCTHTHMHMHTQKPTSPSQYKKCWVYWDHM